MDSDGGGDAQTFHHPPAKSAETSAAASTGQKTNETKLEPLFSDLFMILPIRSFTSPPITPRIVSPTTHLKPGEGGCDEQRTMRDITINSQHHVRHSPHYPR